MKYILAIIAVSFLSSTAIAQEEDEVLYCSDTRVRGFDYKLEDNSLEQIEFFIERHTISLNQSRTIAKIKKSNGEDVFSYDCDKITHNNGVEILRCILGVEMIIFNLETMKYSRASQYGWTVSENGSLSVAYGTCTKF